MFQSTLGGADRAAGSRLCRQRNDIPLANDAVLASMCEKAARENPNAMRGMSSGVV
jgi:hypothetical protein